MKFDTVQEFSDHAATMLQSPDPVVITVDGKVAGVFIPTPDGQMPMDLKREIFKAAAERVRADREANGVTEAEIDEDFKEWREQRRAARGGR